ncbi:MAG TPA: hypothetical protein VF266_16265 [Thermoanaerobaculia bacterium]
MRLIFNTGADDLRPGSAVSAFVILKDGRRVESKPLNCRRDNCTGFQAKSRKTLEWTLDPKTTLRPEEIYRFGLALKSGRRGLFDTGDNRDLHALEVEYVAGSQTRLLLELSNRGGVYRFKSDDSWESDPLRR